MRTLTAVKRCYFYVRCNIGINFVTLPKDAKNSRPCFISLYYMVSPVCEQGETNPDWARWHYLTRLGLPTACHKKKIPQKPYNDSFIYQSCSVKMIGYWLHSFLQVYGPWSMNMPRKNLTNDQPSCPHTWSITHVYCLRKMFLPSDSHFLSDGCSQEKQIIKSFSWSDFLSFISSRCFSKL